MYCLLLTLTLLGLLWRAGRRSVHLEKKISTARSQGDLVARILEKINEARSLPEVLEQIFSDLETLVPYDRIGYARIDPSEGIVRAEWAASRNLEIHLPVGFSAPLKGSSLERLTREEEGVRVINDLEYYSNENPQSESTRLILKEGIRSSLTLPLRAFGRPVGFLFFSSTRKSVYTRKHQRILQLLRNQLSIIIEKSQLMDDLQEANTQLAALAREDSLTGLFNRRHFEEILDLEWRRALRSGSELSLLLLDLDCFKMLNDRYGHEAGDRAIQAVASILKTNAARAGDLAVRWGGEELLLLLPDISFTEGRRIAEKIRREVLKAAIPNRDAPGSGILSVSIGLTSCGPSKQPEAFSTFFHAADRALYRAKKLGRNRVEAFECEKTLG